MGMKRVGYQSGITAVIVQSMLLLIILISSGCSPEDESANEGALNLNLTTDFTITAETRAATKADEAGPSINDFRIQIYKGESEVLYKEWASFSDCPSIIYLQESKYKLKASYGEQHKGAFEQPYYEGSSIFNISKRNTTQASAICKIANVKVSLNYQEGFKKYFKNWSTKVASTGDSILFTKEETRAAFFEPGRVGMNMTLTKQDGKTFNYALPTITTEAGKHYRVNMNVTEDGAGSANLVIVFDKTTEEKPITINLSGDKPFEDAHPFITPTGFVNGRPLSFIEGADLGTVYSLVTARGKIKSCKVTTNSKAVMKLGWPVEGTVDLASTDPKQIEFQNAIKKLGITFTPNMAGIQMAELDFSKVIPKLPSNEQVPLAHTFYIEVTDEKGYTNEAFSLVLQSMMPGFQLFKLDKIVHGIAQVGLSFELTEGSPEKITAEYLKAGKWYPCSFASPIVPSGTHQVYQCVISGFTRAADTQQIRLSYNNGSRYSNEQTLETTPLNFSIQIPDNSEGYVYAKKAYIKVSVGADYADKRDLFSLLQFTANGKPLTKEIGYDKDMLILIKGLTPGSENIIEAKIGTESSQQTIQINTEEELTIPNAGFEEWFFDKTDKKGNPITKNIDFVYWKKWFPWSSTDLNTQGWNTLNQKTTQDGTTPTTIKIPFVGTVPTSPYVGCCYVANSGTIPTDDSHSGKAALIRSVGWGNGSEAAGAPPKRTDFGLLYLGSYTLNEDLNYGIPFKSRPTGFSFWYKYQPKNPADKFIAKMILLNENGEIIASGEFSSGKKDAYTEKKITLTIPAAYKTNKAAKMYISFQSGTKIEPNKTDFNYPQFGNLSDGEFVGSQLWIDNVQLNYE